MIINANSIEEAFARGQELFHCEKSCLRVRTIKKPYKRLWGFVERNGEYLVETVDKEKDEVSKPESKDGYIEIISGKVKVSDPVGDGRYASINPCDPKVAVYLNGNRITDVSIVTEKDRIELNTGDNEEGSVSIVVELSEDRMKAVLTINKSPGRQYYVKDSPETSLLNVSSGCKETFAPDVTLAQCIQELKKAGVNLKCVDGTAVNTLAGQRYGGSAVVAEGKHPVDGKDSVVEYMFRKSEYRNPDFDTDKKVDLLDHTIMPTVKVGEVLAKKVSFAVPGCDGQTVTGETVKARQGKDMPLKAGKGTVLLDNSTKIVAVSSGRPVFKNGMVEVLPQLVIPHNVDPGTGNVYFDGDIRVEGSVMDNMKVVAEGDITVLGNVLQASLSAGGSINVLGNIISSSVYAGRGIANRLCVLPKMQQIHSIIKANFFDANSEVWLNGYKNMCQKSPGMVQERNNKLQNLISETKPMLGLVPKDEADLVNEILRRLGSICNKGVTSVNAKQIDTLNKDIQKYLQTVENPEGRDAHLRFGYAQNSSVQADGDVRVTGRGTYQTNIIAKGAITFSKPSSVVRGGMLIAGKSIDMGVVGSSSGINTYCKVLEEDGKINAVRYFGNTVLNINNKKQVIS